MCCRFRYLILALGFFCTTMISANLQILNFTMLCMNRAENQTAMNGTETPAIRQPWLMWAPALSSLLSAPIYTLVYARGGVRLIIAVALALSAIAAALFPLSVQLGLGAMVFDRFIQGLAYGADFAAMGVICAEWAPLAETGFFICALSVYMPVAGVLANKLSAMACTSSYGWPLVNYGFALLTIVSMVLWLWLYTNPADNHFISSTERRVIFFGKANAQVVKRHAIPYKAIISSPLVLVIWMNAFVEMNAGQFVLMYKPAYFRYVLNYGIGDTGSLASATLLFLIPLKILIGCISDKISCMSVRLNLSVWNTVGVALPGLTLLGATFVRSPAAAYACFVVHDVLFAASGAGYLKCAPLCSRQYTHFVVGVAQLSKCFALLIGPMLLDVLVLDIADPMHWARVFLLFALLTNTANVLFCWLATDKPLAFALPQQPTIAVTTT